MLKYKEGFSIWSFFEGKIVHKFKKRLFIIYFRESQWNLKKVALGINVYCTNPKHRQNDRIKQYLQYLINSKKVNFEGEEYDLNY